MEACVTQETPYLTTLFLRFLISDLFLQVIKPELREIKSELTLFIYKGVVHFCKVIPYSSSGVV